MFSSGALLLVVAVSASGAERLPGFSTPDPNVLAEVRRRHHPGQLLRVTSGAERWSLRAHDLDERGLYDITPLRGTSPPSDPLPWARIERLDCVTDRRTYGRITGGILGGLAGLILSATPDGYPTDQPHRGRDYFFGGALVGALVGGVMGQNDVRVHVLYMARFSRRPPREPGIAVADSSAKAVERSPVAVTDSTRGGSPETSAGDTASARAAAALARSYAEDPAVARALRRIGPGTLLRIESSFGRFQGHASRADREGLHGLHADSQRQPAGEIRSLTWAEIQRIDKRSGSAGEGALRGALIVGVPVGILSGLLTGAILSSGGGDPGPLEMIGGGLLGFGIGGAVGAGFGAAIGSGVSDWRPIYHGR